MKKFYGFTFLLFTALLPNLSFSQGDQEGGLPDKVGSIIDETERLNMMLNTDINAMFQLVKKSIDDANKITQRLQKKYSDENREMSDKERRELAKTIKDIHHIYRTIDEKREQLFYLLSDYDEKVSDQVKKAVALESEYNTHLKINERNYQELLTKTNKTEVDKQNLAFAETNISILRGILDYLYQVRLNMDQVEMNFNDANNQIALFFNAIKNGRETTKYLVDYFELTIEFEEILQNANNIVRLNELTKGIVDSLDNLTKSITRLKKVSLNL